jgi:hypothetical protein
VAGRVSAAVRDPRLGLVGELLLLGSLGGLHLRDLILDRAQKLLPLGQLALDLVALRRQIADDARLLGAGSRQPRLALLDLGLEALDFVDDARVLVGQAVDGVNPVEEVVEARGA